MFVKCSFKVKSLESSHMQKNIQVIKFALAPTVGMSTLVFGEVLPSPQSEESCNI